MKLCSVCRVHPISYMGAPLCKMCGAKYINSRMLVGSVVYWPDDRYNRDQGQYFQSFGPHPFGTLIPHTVQNYPGEIVGASVATNDSVKLELNQVDQQGQQVDAGFSNCHSTDPNAGTIIAQWKAFYAGYLKFSQSTHALLANTTAQFTAMPTYLYNLQQADNSLQSYTQQMNQWAITSNNLCGGAATQNVPGGGGGIVNTLSSVTKNLTTLVILAAVVIGGIYGLSLYEEYKHS